MKPIEAETAPSGDSLTVRRIRHRRSELYVWNLHCEPNFSVSRFLIIGGLVITPVAVGWSLYDRRKRTPAPSPLASEPAELLDNLSKRLASNGFEIQRDVDLQPYHLDLVAVRSRFELSKFGKMTRFVLVAKVSNVDASMVQDYSSRTTKYALDNPHTGLPRGLGRGVLSIPVLVSEDFDDEVKRWITETLAPKHWATFEFPVLISTRLRQVYYCKKTPCLGRGVLPWIPTVR